MTGPGEHEMPVAGEVRAGGRAFTVEGLAWMDREWSTSALAPDQVGWDWFSIQLDDGNDLTISLVRDTDGALVTSYGTLVRPDGGTAVISVQYDVPVTDFKGNEGVDALEVALGDVWGDATRTVRWPLALRVGRARE